MTLSNLNFESNLGNRKEKVSETPELEVKLFGLTETEAVEKIELAGAVKILEDVTLIESFDFPTTEKPIIDLSIIPDRYYEIISKVSELVTNAANLSAAGSYIRLRKEGTEFQFTLKFPGKVQIENVKSEDERNLIIDESEWPVIREMLLKIGMQSQFGKVMPKKRISYVIADKLLRYDIDTWIDTPIPTYIEVEGPNKETIVEGIQLIQMDPAKAESISGKKLFGKYGVFPKV